MAARDNFSASVRNALALRAAYKCSICNQATVGPSDEAPAAISNIGTAAHICAAAPGGPRYDSKMTPGERASIDNGIWLCANHGRLVDTDVFTYTVEVLQRYKADHYSRCKQALTGAAGEQNIKHLIAFGPEIVAVGEINYAQDDQWHFEIEHFVTGDFSDLVRLAGNLRSIPEYDRYVLVNSLGEGRSIGSLSVRRERTLVLVECQVAPNAPRTPAASLPSDFALSANNDLMLDGGDIAVVSGIAALPQKLMMCLSMRRGESPFFQDFGSRLSEYWVNYMGSPWLEELLKLDIVRLASIPYSSPISNESYTPLMCVERVFRVAILGDLVERRILVHLELEIAGVGPWSHNLAVHIG
ncbi:hypothetical protein JK203_13915 [Gluconobacter cerinus]|uniref:hypothetical protein n=1 Tax=Gluconobacter TaxID=441 RepID=UPI000B210B1C|nr:MULTISPECIES: hypothetical protein [Gluconobacter]MBS1041930.1 hypothetical protein [Gluconobacter cerinus]MBS1045755.1 hypothetical protein [Gluconobacter cerinus]MBS1048518.1 hypothetical protein [Gluconobacter cerinus]